MPSWFGCITNAVRPGYHCRYRASEWQAAIAIFGMGVWTVLWPGAFADGRFAAVDNLIAVPVLTWLLMILGGMRMTALYINGRVPFVGPVIRMLGALAGAALFSQLGYALWLNHLSTEVAASPGIVIYSSLAGSELYSAYRAAGDARRKPV